MDGEWFVARFIFTDAWTEWRTFEYIKTHVLVACIKFHLIWELCAGFAIWLSSVRLIQNKLLHRKTLALTILYILQSIVLLNKQKGNDWWSRFSLFFSFFLIFLLFLPFNERFYLETIKYVNTIDPVLKTNWIEYHRIISLCVILKWILCDIWGCLCVCVCICCEFKFIGWWFITQYLNTF